MVIKRYKLYQRRSELDTANRGLGHPICLPMSIIKLSNSGSEELTLTDLVCDYLLSPGSSRSSPLLNKAF